MAVIIEVKKVPGAPEMVGSMEWGWTGEFTWGPVTRFTLEEIAEGYAPGALTPQEPK